MLLKTSRLVDVVLQGVGVNHQRRVLYLMTYELSLSSTHTHAADYLYRQFKCLQKDRREYISMYAHIILPMEK